MFVSGEQRSDSVIHIHVSILFQILFPFRLLHNIEHSSVFYNFKVEIGHFSHDSEDHIIGIE